MKQLLTYILLFSAFVSCSNESTKKPDKVDYNSLKGHWQCETKDGYTELQISDSLYYYVDEGGYIGSVVPIPYKIKNDSLFWLDDLGEKLKGFKIIQSNSTTLILVNKFEGEQIWNKFDTYIEIKQWNKENDSIIKFEFLKREKEY